jgi:hypothetical protein
LELGATQSALFFRHAAPVGVLWTPKFGVTKTTPAHTWLPTLLFDIFDVAKLSLFLLRP